MAKLVFFADNDTNSDAVAVNKAMIQENPDAYVFVGDGPYSESGTEWVDQMKASFDDKKDKLIFSRGNHDEDESESKQTQEDIEAWFPAAKGIGFEDTWLSAKQVGNTYVISMDTQDLDIEFERDQFNWVKAELTKAKDLRAAGTIDWIIVLFHKPFFTLKSSHSPYTAVRFLYKTLFRDAQVDFCVSGHNHNTQLWLPMIPSDSQANGEGQQLFTKLPDGTFDFSKDHGAAFIVTGHAGHEWNAINDTGAGVANVQYFKDDGKYGYTLIETNGKSATVFAKDTDNAVTFEYKVTREGDGGTGPVEPPNCSDPAKCIDSQTGECRPLKQNEHKSPTNGTCMSNTNPPGDTICPRDYHYDQSLQKCIPDLEPQINPICPAGTTWNGSVCVGTVTPPCLQGECKDKTTGQCRPIGPNEIKDAFGMCAPKPVLVCPDGECIDPQTQQCRPISANEQKNPTTGICEFKQPDTGGEVDEHGIKWLVAKGPKTIVTMSRDEATDDRWSGNVTGLMNGFEATFIGKSTGTNDSSHFAMKQFSGNHSGSGSEDNAWYDTGLRIDGSVQLQTEYPHPNNHDFSLSDSEQFIKKISKGLEGNWIGLKWCVMLVKPNGTRQDGIRLRMWVDEDPLDANNKPKNDWKLVYDFIDTGQVIPADKQLVDEQDCEVRRSDTDRHDIYGEGTIIEDAQEGAPGLHVRPLS